MKSRSIKPAQIFAEGLYSDYRSFLVSLREKVNSQLNNNPSIKYIPSKDVVVEDQGINFLVKILETLKHKPQGDKETFEADQK